MFGLRCRGLLKPTLKLPRSSTSAMTRVGGRWATTGPGRSSTRTMSGHRTTSILLAAPDFPLPGDCAAAIPRRGGTRIDAPRCNVGCVHRAQACDAWSRAAPRARSNIQCAWVKLVLLFHFLYRMQNTLRSQRHSLYTNKTTSDSPGEPRVAIAQRRKPTREGDHTTRCS
eukprot:COSAG02_NODE_19092_length_900_cov_1.877653_1_plen_170_part_00